jgi:hypothetical protein
MRIQRAAFLLGSLSFVACGGGSEASPGDTAQREIAQSSTRLEGTWVLVEYQPAAQIEPMFAALLAAQMGQMRIALHAGTMKVEGVGVSAERTYRVTQAAADGFSAVMVDPSGVEYRVTGAFQGVELAFVSQTDPWRGTGRLRRAQ